jgi:hypothetical protein
VAAKSLHLGHYPVINGGIDAKVILPQGIKITPRWTGRGFFYVFVIATKTIGLRRVSL